VQDGLEEMRTRWVTVAGSFCLLFASISAGQELPAADDTARLRELLKIQQQQLDEQRRALEELKARLMERGNCDSVAVIDPNRALGETTIQLASVQAPPPSASTASADPAQPAEAGQQPQNPTQEIAREQPEGPALEIGPARLRVGGYLGLTGIYRSTNSGGGIGTSFASIPYEDQVQGNVSEARLSAQSSRISLRVDADFPEPGPRFRRLSGYFEMDFGGTTPGTVAVSSTSVGFRLRQAFAEVRYGETFLLAAGQAFSLMTPAKDQISIWPSDVEMSQSVDTNYLAGMIWDRAPQLRVTWRPSTRFNWAVSAENPEQQLGKGLVTLPTCCSSDLDAQYNTGSDELKVPNLMPDIATRVAFNPVKPFHVDVGGVIRVFRHTLQPYDDDFKEVGGGVGINVRFNATSGTKFLLQSAFGSGLGRYIGGLVPDVAFRSDGSISAIGTTSWVGGVEQKFSDRLSMGGYYSGVNAEDKFFVDTDGSYIGFGYPGSSNSNNRKVQEVTGTAAYQIVKSHDRGSAQLNLQASWLTREPWSIQQGLRSADAFMFFVQVRYNLP
jgi:hypothetical protein